MANQAVDVKGTKGMVTGDNYLAVQVGRDILLDGGNAVDAAVATALALTVVKPSSNGIGGYGGNMVIYLADTRRVVSIDYNTRAPKAATEDMFEPVAPPAEKSNVGGFSGVEGRKNMFGPLAVSVPGTIAGLSLAAERFGCLGWSALVQPAMKLASEGFTVWPGLSANIRSLIDNTDPESAAAFLHDGRIPEDGETLKLPDVARLLGVLAEDPGSFYRGEPARMIAERIRSMGGLLTEQDMNDFTLDVSEPYSIDYRGHKVYACTGISGSPTAFEAMAVMQFLNTKPYAPDDPAYWGDLAGALILSWHDRLALLGDVPGFDTLVDHLMSHRYAELLAARVRAGNFTKIPSEFDPTRCTVHVNACDADHNMVALTQTHGGGYGSRVVVPGLGIVLGHGMSRFNPEAGHPNSPGPGKQPLHNMSPLIITKDGMPVAAIGLPGGRTIPSLMPQFVADIADYGMTAGEQLRFPRIHTQGDAIQHTDDLPEYAQKAISQRGHELARTEAIGGIASSIVIRGDTIFGASQGGEKASLGI